MTHTTPDEELIAKVFESVARKGILAKPNHLCCQSCGSADLHGQIQDDDRYHGIAFYHEQDDEYARNNGSLYIAYGSKEGTEEAAALVGQVVAEALREAGLTVVWDGDRCGLEFIDDGKGMTPAQLHGLGVLHGEGCRIIRQFCAEMGACVYWESVEGLGTKVTLQW